MSSKAEKRRSGSHRAAMMTLEAKQKLLQAKIATMIRPNSMPNCAKSTLPVKKTPEHPDASPSKTEETGNGVKPSSYGMNPLFSSVNINCDKWLLTMDEASRAKLENPPSFADGINQQAEEDIRYLGSELIQAGSILLRLPQTAAATGQILFQRFYYQKSLASYHFEHAVMACLMLASKIEEAPRRARDVINVFHRLEQLNRLRRAGRPITREVTAKLQPRPLDARYVNTKNMVIKTERRILTALGFVVHVKHPHKLLVSYLHTLNLTEHTDLIQRAWSYMNDGLRTDMFVRYRPETIACACIFLAARTVENAVSLPSSPFPWFELFDASDRDVNAIALSLLRLYRRPRVNWAGLNTLLEEVHAAKLPVKTEAAQAKTEVVVKKILEQTRKYRGRNDENGRDEKDRERERERNRKRASSSRSRSPRRGSPKRRRGEDSVDPRRRDRKGDDYRRVERDDNRRHKEDRRKEKRRSDRAREHVKQREREVYQALGKRNRALSPPDSRSSKITK